MLSYIDMELQLNKNMSDSCILYLIRKHINTLNNVHSNQIGDHNNTYEEPIWTTKCDHSNRQYLYTI